jgi:hypothetical protein
MATAVECIMLPVEPEEQATVKIIQLEAYKTVPKHPNHRLQGLDSLPKGHHTMDLEAHLLSCAQ